MKKLLLIFSITFVLLACASGSDKAEDTQKENSSDTVRKPDSTTLDEPAQMAPPPRDTTERRPRN